MSIQSEFSALRELFTKIRDERGSHANTANRIGSAFLALLDYVLNAPFLRKDKEDVAAGEVTFLRGLKIGDYSSVSLTGGEWSVDDKEHTYLTTDYLEVRMKAIFEELMIKKTSTIGGNVILSPAGSVTAHDVQTVSVIYNEVSQEAYRCYFLAEQDGNEISNDFAIGDLIRSESFNLNNGKYHKMGNHFLWRLCIGRDDEAIEKNGKKYHYIDLSVTDCATNSDRPAKGDVLNQCGNRDNPERQTCMFFSSVGTYAPSITLYQGVDNYSFDKKEYVEYGVNNSSKKAFFNVYGDMYVGDRPTAENNYEGSTYVKFQQDCNGKGKPRLQIKAELDVKSTIGGKNIDKYIEDNTLSEAAVNNIISNSQIISDLQNQIDGAIETWFYEGVPTLGNVPAAEWKTDSDKNIHLGDLYYDTSTGKAYRFAMVDNNIYKWLAITDTDIAKALETASKAQETANGKMKVFCQQPTPPYYEGDLWVNATYPQDGSVYKNDILRCTTGRTFGAFNINDWTLSSKYTDDTEAHKAQDAVAKTQESLQNLSNTVSNNKSAFDKYTQDGYVDGAEIVAMQQDIKRLVDDYTAAEKAYNEVVGSEVLKTDTGAETKELTDLKIAKQALDSAHKELVDYLNDITKRFNESDADGKKTISNRVGTLFDNFQTAYSAFYNTLGIANAYITSSIYSITLGNVTNYDNLKYLKNALQGDSTIQGGLMLSSTIVLRDAKGAAVMSGMNGIVDETKQNQGLESIATWWGGAFADKKTFLRAGQSIADTIEGKNAVTDYATSLVRFDGSGYLADGAIWWDKTGNVHANPASFIISEKNVGVYLSFLEPVWKPGITDNTLIDNVQYLIAKKDFRSLVGIDSLATEGYLKIGGAYLVWDNTNKAIRIAGDKDGKTLANLYTTGGITAYGAGSGTDGGGGLNGSVLTYANAISLTTAGNELSQIASAWSIKKLYDKIEAIDVSDQLTNYLQKTEAANLYQPKGHYLTSLGINVPTGLTVSGSPVTSSGNITIGLAAGYSIPTTAKQTNWDTAYRWYTAIVGKDSDGAIDKWDEIVAFLAKIDDSTTLDGIIGGINSSISTETSRAKAAEGTNATDIATLRSYFNGSVAKNAKNADTLDGYHAANIQQAGWVNLYRTGDSANEIKWTRIGRFLTNGYGSKENDAMIEFNSNGDQNYWYFAHGTLMLSSYLTTSRSLMLTTYGMGSIHFYATIDEEGYIWLGHNAWYSGNSKFRVLYKGTNVEIYYTNMVMQTKAPANEYVTDNGTYKMGQGVKGINYLNNVNASSASKLETTRKLWGQNFDGGGDVAGMLTLADGSHAGLKLGSAYLSSLSGCAIFQNVKAIRFGGDSWNWSAWAGLSYDENNKMVNLGLADGSIFTATTTTLQTDGTLNLVNITKLLLGGLGLEYDVNNNALKVNGNLYATGGITAYGAGSGTGGGGGGLDATVKLFSEAIALTQDSRGFVASAYSVAALNSKIATLQTDVTTLRAECKLDCRDIDFGLSSDNSSADNWHTYQDVAEGMFILVDNKYGQGQSIGVLLQYKDNMNHALNQVVISSCELLPTEENFSSHQDGIMFFKCRSWNTLTSPEYAGAKNTWSEWHDINERITNDDIDELFN